MVVSLSHAFGLDSRVDIRYQVTFYFFEPQIVNSVYVPSCQSDFSSSVVFDICLKAPQWRKREYNHIAQA